MTRFKKHVWLSAAALVAFTLAGCITERSGDTGNSSGEPAQTADRKFTVNGPVRIDLTNASGNSRVTAGPVGEVQVHAEFRAKARLFRDRHGRLADMIANPPISQEGNFIRIGGSSEHMSGVTVNYTITVPADTQIHGMAASGTLVVSGIKGPANFVAASGKISAEDISGDVQATAGSGNVELSRIQGQVEATAGSGDIKLSDVHGEIRAQAGSGDIQIVQPAQSVEASTGSGSITVSQVSADLRVRTTSGDVKVDGNPLTTAYWEVRSSSGTVLLHVPGTANFRFYARTSSGDIDTQIPIVMEGTTGKHELRARLGDGKARVEIETSSGKISLR
ncbi:MAG: DUF4097 family beta strand repeat-containing protein [Candidatus Acidiferrales bacterium]